MFDKIAPYLANPLVLIGFVLLLVFGIHRALIGSGIIPPVTQRTGGRIVQMLLRYGFVLALVVIVLGFGLPFYKSHLDAASRVDANAIADKYVSAHKAELAHLKGEIGFYRTQLTQTVEALADLRGHKDAPPGINEALALIKQGKAQAAERIFQAVYDRNAGNIKEAAAAKRHQGALAYLNDPQKALDAYRRATQLDPNNAAGWNQLGILSYRTGDLSQAEAAFRRVLSLGRTRHARYLLALAYGNLGIFYKTRGDLGRAEAMDQKALELAKAVGNKAIMANVYTNLGIVYGTRGNLDQAEAMLQKALELDKALGQKEGMASDYTNLGNIYETRRNLERAEAMYEQALELDKALGQKEGMASDYGNLAVVNQTRGDLDQAEAMHQKELELDKALGKKEGMANAYGNLGLVYKTRGDLDQAEAMHQKALELHKALGSKAGMASDYGNLGNVYENRGDLDRAEAMYQKALALFETIGAKPQIAQVRALIKNLPKRNP